MKWGEYNKFIIINDLIELAILQSHWQKEKLILKVDVKENQL